MTKWARITHLLQWEGGHSYSVEVTIKFMRYDVCVVQFRFSPEDTGVCIGTELSMMLLPAEQVGMEECFKNTMRVES